MERRFLCIECSRLVRAAISEIRQIRTLWNANSGMPKSSTILRKEAALSPSTNGIRKQMGASKSNPIREFHFISSAEYFKISLIHYLATATFRGSSHSSHILKPWEHYGRIGE